MNNDKNYQVEVFTIQDNTLVISEWFDTEVEAIDYIEDSCHEDMLFGDSNVYEYRMNGETIC